MEIMSCNTTTNKESLSNKFSTTVFLQLRGDPEAIDESWHNCNANR